MIIMKIHRFLGDFDLASQPIQIDDQEMISQIRNVLRLRVGDRVTLVDSTGQEAVVTITKLGRDSLKVKIVESKSAKTEKKFETSLFCAILKKENFELVAQKATELGVGRIVPIVTERTVKLGLRQDRLEKIVKEACEQSGQVIRPAIDPVVKLETALADLLTETTAIFLDQSGMDFRPDFFDQAVARAIFIGPEGGWTDEEIKWAKNRGLIIAKVSDFTLRAETAGIIGSFLLINNKKI